MDAKVPVEPLSISSHKSTYYNNVTKTCLFRNDVSKILERLHYGNKLWFKRLFTIRKNLPNGKKIEVLGQKHMEIFF